MMPRRPFTTSLVVFVAVITAGAAFQVAMPLKTRRAQKPLFRFFAEESSRDMSSTKTETEPAVTEMETSSEIEAPKFEAQDSEKTSAPAVNSLDFS